MDESGNEAMLLLNSLKSSPHAQLFVDEAKKVLELAGSEIKREFLENLCTADYINDVRKIPRTTKQQIERLCLNKGEIAGTRKLLEVVFRYDKNVFYAFIELVIKNHQSSLFKKLFFAVQQQNRLFLIFSTTNEASPSLQSSSFFSQSIRPVDRILIDHPSGSYSSSVSPSEISQPRYSPQTIRPVDRVLIDHPSGSYNSSVSPSEISQPRYLSRPIPVDGFMQNSDQSRSISSTSSNSQILEPQQNLSNSLPVDRELYGLRILRRQVIDYFGSIENFHSQLGSRAIQENNDNLQPRAFTTMDYGTEQQ